MVKPKWYDFYKGRVNSTYQEYFETRYEPLLRVINELKTDSGIFELGCGIASVSKAIGGQFWGIDLEQEMVRLANENTQSNNFFKGDIKTIEYDSDLVGVSHGVLEHFQDDDILYICERHVNSVHYVPLDKYKVQSYGDGRLLPYEHWLELTKPKYYELFNDNHDLIFIV